MPIHLHSPKTIATPIWIPQASPPALGEGDLHLWRIPIGHPDAPEDRGRDELAEACLPLIGEDQRVRALRMNYPPARGRYIRAQAGLRRVLGLYLGAAPQSLVFRYGPVGKPSLAAAPKGFEFNLTTTHDLALVGISLGSPLGVDCERIRPRRGLRGIARRMFEPGRADTIASLPEAEALTAFYRAWTALEADAKSDGRGLFRERAAGAEPPQVRHCVPAPGYIAAVARARVPPPSGWQTLELEDRLGD